MRKNVKIQKIVDDFNKKNLIGSQVLWRSNSLTDTYISYETTSVAFLSNCNEPVVFFKGKSGYCSIEKKFIK